MSDSTYDIQQVLSRMMKQVHRVLKDNKIDYFVSDGTLLGAIRHEGFIPWDDDIDLSMTRENYNKFILEAEHILPSNLVFITNSSDECFPFLFGKIYDKSTTLIEVSNKTYIGGIYIDVFPLDSISDNKSLQIKAVSEMNKIKRLMRLRNNFFFGNKIRKGLLKIYSIPIKIFWTNKKISNSASKVIEKYRCDDSDSLINYFGAYGPKQIYKKEWFHEYTEIKFSDFQVNSIKYSHDLLTMTYGDYSILPPENKRFSHHEIYHVDLNKPYSIYKFFLVKKKGK